ncbi:MAG: hypothetical protein ABIU54_14850 [Candidatus Eisenbacteria bacterium]
MKLPLVVRREFPLGWVALISAVGGAIVTSALQLDPMQNPDSIAFLAIARSVLAGHGFRYQEALIPGLDLLAFRAPGYPAFLAAGLMLHGIGSVIAIQGAMNGLAAALVGAIARDLGAGRWAWLAFALRLLWPSAWFYSGLLLNETLFEFVSILAVWLVLRGDARRQVSWCILAGLCIAGAVLCRPVGIALAGALGLWLLFRFPRAVLPFTAAALLAWSPWPVRNARALHAFVPFTTNGGATTWAGTTDGRVLPAYLWMGAHVQLGELGFDRHFYALARERMRADPGAMRAGALRRAVTYLGPIRGTDSSLWASRFAMMAALAALAMATARRRAVLPLLIWVAQGAMMVPIFLIARYRFPTEWCVVVTAALGVQGVAERWGPRRASALALAALVLCIGGSLALSRR